MSDLVGDIESKLLSYYDMPDAAHPLVEINLNLFFLNSWIFIQSSQTLSCLAISTGFQWSFSTISVIMADISSCKSCSNQSKCCRWAPSHLFWLGDAGPHGEGPGVVFVAHSWVLHLVVEELVGRTDILSQPVILSNDMLGKQVVVVSQGEDTLVSHWNKTFLIKTFLIKVWPPAPTSLVFGDFADLHWLPAHHVQHGLLLIGDVFYWHF